MPKDKIYDDDAYETPAVTEYWMKYYVTNHCTLCGNWGVIDTTGTNTPAGYHTGRKNWCICPNGQSLRYQNDGQLPK